MAVLGLYAVEGALFSGIYAYVHLSKNVTKQALENSYYWGMK
jgi:hypothetical protein